MGGCGLNSYDVGLKSVAGSCEQSNKASGSMKGRKCIEYLSVVNLMTQSYETEQYGRRARVAWNQE
jgi:hypothetical protein